MGRMCGLNPMANSQPQGLNFYVILEVWVCSWYLLAGLLFPNSKPLRHPEPTFRVLFLIFVLGCSYVIWKQFGPFGLYFYDLLRGSGAVLILGFFSPLGVRVHSEYCTQWPMNYESCWWELALSPALCDCRTLFPLFISDAAFSSLMLILCEMKYVRISTLINTSEDTLDFWDSTSV